MRKIKAFSSKMIAASEGSRSTFSGSSRTNVVTNPNGELQVFMTPSLIKQSIKEMKRSVNIRFLQLMKSSKSYAKNLSKTDDIPYLKKFMVMQLTMLLGEYVEMLKVTPSLQLVSYLKLNASAPQAVDSARILSRVMIQANKVRKANGVLPPKNQRDLNRAMDNFISDVVSITSSSIRVDNPMINESLANTNEA